MAIQKTEAFVIHTQPFRSSSLIVTFFSKSFGKLKGIAKGVRREREVRGALFELFTHLEIVFYEKLRSDLHLISDAAIIESNDTLRTHLRSIAYASYYSELVDQLSETHDPHPGIFDLMNFCFRFLPAVPEEKLTRLFEIKLLGEIGWFPHLEGCLNCQKRTPKKSYFSIKQGCLFCEKCVVEYPESRPVTQNALDALQFYSAHSPETALKFAMNPFTEKELKRLISDFILYRLGDRLKSQKFIEKVGPVLA